VINLREVRISILYFADVVIMILVILFIRKYDLLSGSIYTGTVGLITACIVAFIMLGIIPCLIVSIYHMVKATKYGKVYYKENHYAEWNYSKSEWRSFILNNYKMNNIDEMKFFLKAAVKYFIVVLPCILLYFAINEEGRRHSVAYLLCALLSFLLCFIPVMVRNVISMIDHMLFTNRTIILMGGSIIMNGEICRLDVPRERELMKKEIKNGNIEIHYAVTAR
jgi:hypothetical protein